MLPFFEKSVNFTEPDMSRYAFNESFSSSSSFFSPAGGPLHVSFPGYINAISSWVGKAFDQLGFNRVPSFTDGRVLGWSHFLYTVDPDTQTRSSSESSFLREALRETTNLNIYTSTLAKRIIVDDCKIVKGVLVNTAGVEYTISAAREVILSAGVVRYSHVFLVTFAQTMNSSARLNSLWSRALGLPQR
jgi:choline dehydrogenase-like flavoprotein